VRFGALARRRLCPGDIDVTGDQQCLYLDDLIVGQTFESGTKEVTADAIKRFANEFDPQPFHLDEGSATSSFFGGLAASGWHTASMTMDLLVRSLPLAGGIIGLGMDELRWPKPVRPGDTLHVRSEVVEVRPSSTNPRRGTAKVRTVTYNQHGEEVQIVTANLALQRR
jgi:acyl dehydratase